MFIVGATGAESQTASFQYVLTSLDGYAWQRQSVNESGFRGFAGNAGVFVATNGVDLFQASLGASAAPLIAASQISPAVLTRERSTALSVTAAGIGPFTYQWRRDGVPIHGANQPSYTVMANSVTTVSGQYDVVVSNATGSVVSASATITVDDSWLTNLSSRAYVGLGEDQLIQGFVIRTRDVSVAYRLLARAVGPGLTPLGVHEVLANPYLKLYRQIDQAQISENDDWSSSGMQPSLSYYFDAVGASPLPSGSADAALLPTLSSGAYSLGVTGVNGGSGIALSELYDLELSPGRLVNLSARARVGTGDRTLIVGFVIAGGKPLKVLIRGIGPTLTGLGVVHALADPKLTLFNSAGREIRNNDNWSQATNADDIRSAMTATGAFRLSDGSLDAALLETLEPGIYTAHVTSADGISSGVALAEIYEAR